MPSLDELQTWVDKNIRKGLTGSIFIKRWDAADDEITALKDATGLLALPPGYVDVGRITKDQGASWTREVETSDVTSLGSASPSRRDIVSVTSGLSFTMQESKRQAFELHEGIDLSAVRQDAHGNVTWDQPDRPATIDYRVLALFKDGEGADAIYFGKWLARAQVSDTGEQAWNEENEVQYPVTLTAFVDEEAGTAVRSLWAGSAARMTAMGFPTAP